jgi:hypothetical protein
MKTAQMLTGFFQKSETDPNISKTHISLYVSLVCLWQKQESTGPMYLYSYDVMALAKISSSATYVRVMDDLHQSGYLKYIPSYYWKKPSRIELLRISPQTSKTDHAAQS